MSRFEIELIFLAWRYLCAVFSAWRSRIGVWSCPSSPLPELLQIVMFSCSQTSSDEVIGHVWHSMAGVFSVHYQNTQDRRNATRLRNNSIGYVEGGAPEASVKLYDKLVGYTPPGAAENPE